MTGIPKEVFQSDRTGAMVPQASGDTTGLTQPEGWFLNWASNGNTLAQPIIVNEYTALNYAALYTCVSLIAGTIAALPCKVFRGRKDGGQDEIYDHPVYDLMQREYNPSTSSMTGREAEIGHLLTWGNSFTQIVKTRKGEIVRLQPIGPDLCWADINASGQVQYKIRSPGTGKTEVYPLDQILHTPYFSFDSIVGLSVVRTAKSLVRNGISADRSAERYVTRGFRPPGAVKLRDGKGFKTIAEGSAWRDRFRQIHMQDDSDINVVVLEDGAEWQSLGTNPETAQLLESRKFSRLEIAGLYHIPPHLSGDVEKTTAWGTGIEELNIGFVVYCLLPILRRIEQERNRKLFPKGSGLYCEHMLNGLLRGDALKRAQALQILMDRGIITVNEWRRLEGMNPIPGGNVRYFPLNMGRVDADTGEDIPSPGYSDASTAPNDPNIPLNGARRGAVIQALPVAKPRGEIATHLRKAIVGAVGRLLRRECGEAARATKKPSQFIAWVEGFYGTYPETMGETITPLFEAWKAADLGELDAYAAEHLERSKADLIQAAECQPSELVSRVELLGKRWQSERLAELSAKLSEVKSHATL